MSLTANALHVVTVITNPGRYRRRYELYEQFAKRVEDAGATLWTVEHAFGEREHAVTSSAQPRHIQVRGSHELWHKENLLNIGVARLPADWKYVATVDADLTFVRPDWVSETLQQLQHAPVVQMFSEISNLTAGSESLPGRTASPGFVESWKRGMALKNARGCARTELYFHPKRAANACHYPHAGGAGGCCRAGEETWLGSPGGAWAYRREAWDALGGLIDYSIVGAADYFMATGLFGIMTLAIQEGYHGGFVEELLQWQKRALTLRHNVGVVPGWVLHHWHGRMSERGYGERWKILVKHRFNPRTDLKRDWQGLLQLHDDGSDRMRRLRDDLRSYTASRNEDSID